MDYSKNNEKNILNTRQLKNIPITSDDESSSEDDEDIFFHKRKRQRLSMLSSSSDGDSDEIEENYEDDKDSGPEKENENPCIDWNITGEKRAPFEFSSNDGIKFNIPVESHRKPLFYMEKFLDNELIDILVEQTNLYANEFLENITLKEYSRLKKWYPTNSNEMRCFIALVILQGIVKKPALYHYFSKRECISTPFFNKIMDGGRFSLLCKFLHFEDNKNLEGVNPKNKIAKIRNVFENIVHKCSTFYIPKRNICIDESLLLWKGRLSWKQYIPSKRARFGVKFFVLCESESGYIWNFIVYTGKNTEYGTHYPQYKTSSRVVLELCHNLLGHGYTLFLDNWYTDIELAEKLNSHQTDIVGTIRKNRMKIPSDVSRASLEKGSHIARFKNKMMVLKWKDKKDILLLSTIHDNTMIDIQKRNMIKTKPEVVIDYNKYMGGVDVSDGLIVAYSSARKRMKKYYKKIFLHILDIISLNSFLLYKKQGGKLTRVNFLLEYIENTIELYSNNTSMTTRHLGRPPQATPTRFIGRHFPDFIPPTKCNNNPRRRCSLCSKNSKRKETRYWCSTCKVALCAAPCFKEYHACFHNLNSSCEPNV